jgi:ribose transport system substrate-binding protein
MFNQSKSASQCCLRLGMSLLLAAGMGGSSAAATAEQMKFPGSSGDLLAQTQKSLEGKKIVYVPLVTGFALFDAWTYTIKKETTDLGMKLTMYDPNWNVDATTQAIQAGINGKADVIIAHNPDIKVLAKLLKEANDKGIYVVQVNMVSNQKTDAYVGADWLGIGAGIATDLVKACGKGSGKSGKIAIVQGPPTGAPSFDQYTAAKAVFKNHPEIKVVSDQSAGPLWSSDEAKKIVSSVLTQNPDLCAVYGFYDYMDVGSSAAIKEAGKQGKVLMYTVGGGAQTMCEKIKAGEFTKYWSYNGMRQGQDLMTAVKVLLQSGQKPGTMKLALYSNNDILTKATVRPDSCFSEELVRQK